MTEKLSEIDFRFLESDYELYVLRNFLDVLENQLVSAIEKERENTKAQIQKIPHLDEAEIGISHQRLNEIIYVILPRFFRNPFLVTLWATCEFAILEVANYLQERTGQVLSLNGTKGKNFLDKANKYFKNTLDFPLFIDDKAYGRFEMLRIVRNIIVHCSNGRTDAIRSGDMKKLEKWAKDKVGIFLSISCIVFSENFLRETYEIASNAVRSLLDRAKTKYPQ